MTKFSVLTIVTGLVLVGCSPVDSNDNNEKNIHEVADSTSTLSELASAIAPGTEQNVKGPPHYEVNNKGELSIQDAKNAYEMCARALTDYYKAVWNGTDIELNTFMNNENLVHYTQKKIQSQFDLHFTIKHTDDFVQSVGIATRDVDWDVEYTNDEDGGFLYLHLPAEIKFNQGSFGEATEFLVRNEKDQLVIVDWYTGGKDTYDFMVRGENETIDNPTIWNDSQWVKEINSNQLKFSSSTH
ncbi:MAG: hypothetical protein ABS934_09915 [Psychrobacillus sp.]